MLGNIVEKKWLKIILTVEEKLIKAETVLASTLFIIALLFLFIQVLSRFIFKIPIPWSEELIRYSFVTFVFLGSAIATYDNASIEINVLTEIFKKAKDEDKKRRFIKYSNILRYTVIFLMCTIFSTLCCLFTMKVYKVGMVTPAMGIPMWLIDFVIFLGLLFSALHSLVKMITELAGYPTTQGENL